MTAPAGAEAAIQAALTPLPPRRPAEFEAVAATAIAMPLPPPRPVQFAAIGAVALPAAEPLQKAALLPTPVRRGNLVAADADPKQQLRALFEAVSAEAAAVPASSQAPVHVAAARARPDAAPDAVVSAEPERVTTRFSQTSPGDSLASQRFSGNAARGVAGGR